MKFVIVEEKNNKAFENLIEPSLRDRALEESVVCIGAVDDEKNLEAVGILIGQVINNKMHLIWLYVDENSRSKGIGGSLVMRMINLCRKQVYEIIAEYEPSNWSLDNIFYDLGFKQEHFKQECYLCTIGELKQREFFKKPLSKNEVTPLKDVSTGMLNTFSQRLEKSQGIVAIDLPIDKGEYEKDISMFCTSGLNITDCVFIKYINNQLEMVYAYSGSHGTSFAKVLLACGIEAMKKYPDETIILLPTINHKAAAIIEKMLQLKPREMVVARKKG